MPGPDPHPDHDDHGRHPIAIIDNDRQSKRDYDKRPVTVAELLDSLFGPVAEPLDFPELYNNAFHADRDVCQSFVHIAQALIGVRDPADLTPAERDEYDRRPHA